MTIVFTRSFEKQYKKAPQKVQRKFQKQLQLLIQNFQHPSVQAKKLVNKNNIWEGRIDLHWRFTFQKAPNELIIRSMGSHDIFR